MRTVLLADADRDFRDVYAWLLSSYGFQVETTGDGLECLRKLRESVPDLLILDLDLPWGGGDGVLAFVREEPRLLPARVVLTSAIASVAGLDAFALPPLVQTLVKPFQLTELVERASLATFMEEKRPSNDNAGILVVDDEYAVRNFLKTHLQKQGFRVWTASNGEEALDQCCDHGDEIHVLLLAMRILHLDGPEILEGIREFKPALPVCFMGDMEEYELSDSLEPRVRHFFRKPFRLDDVVRVLRRLVKEPKVELQEVDTFANSRKLAASLS